MKFFLGLMFVSVALTLASCCCPPFCKQHGRWSYGPGPYAKEEKTTKTEVKEPDRAEGSTGSASETESFFEDPVERPECREARSSPQPNSVQGQNPLPVAPICQEGMYSCWSTSTEMILWFLGGGRVRQCDQANHAFRSLNCCGGNDVLRLGNCDLPWYPDFEQWGYKFNHRWAPLEWGQATGEIKAGRPFAFAWARRNPNTATAAASVQATTVSHMLVVIGYGTDSLSGVDVLIAFDPSPVRPTQAVMVPFTDYDGSSGDYTHAEDYWSIRPKGIE